MPVMRNSDLSIALSQEEGVVDQVRGIIGIGIPYPLEIPESPSVRSVMPTVIGTRDERLTSVIREDGDHSPGTAVRGSRLKHRPG